MMAVMASVLRVGWCLISSSIAVPRLEAVSPAQTKTQTQTQTTFTVMGKVNTCTDITLDVSAL